MSKRPWYKQGWFRVTTAAFVTLASTGLVAVMIADSDKPEAADLSLAGSTGSGEGVTGFV